MEQTYQICPTFECDIRKYIQDQAGDQKKNVMPQLPLYQKRMPFGSYESYVMF